jgi:hypothetical protein
MRFRSSCYLETSNGFAEMAEIVDLISTASGGSSFKKFSIKTFSNAFEGLNTEFENNAAFTD